MKILLTLMLTTASIQINAAELDSISLITPLTYTRPSTFSQTVKSKIMAGAASTFNIDIEKKVTSKLDPYKKDLIKYFPKSGELDTFVKTVVRDGIKQNLDTVSDENLIKFYRYLGNNLVGKIADKILQTEGVADSERRALWVNKLTQPFNSCVDSAVNSQYDANHCIDALTSSLVPSTGIGLVYELSRASLNPSLPEAERTPFNNQQANLYKGCIAKTKASSTDVMNCALSTMKSGVSKVTDLSLTLTIEAKASSPAKSVEIKKAVWPAFTGCTQKVGNNTASKVSYTDQFMGCIDNLVQNTGSQLVLDKIANTPSIKNAMSAPEVKKLSVDKSAQFTKCAEEQKAKGTRKDGMLDIGRCENAITNEVTYKVVSETLKNTAKASAKADKGQGVKLGNEGTQLLDKCWSNTQTETARETCLRKTIVSFAQNLATVKLNDAIPSDMPGKSELNKSSANDLGKCLSQELPSNISASNDLTKKIDGCSGKLTRSVALKVADFQIRSTAGENLSPEATNLLVKNLVEDEFAKCIGNSPSDEQLDKCSSTLTVKAAKTITETSFDKEVNAYLAKSGGLKSLGVTQTQVNSFLSDLNKTNKACIDQKSAGPVMDQVNLCIKASVKKIAFFFGDIQFNKSIGDMYKGHEADKKIVEVQFKKSLGDCLGTKDGKEFSISDYTKNLYTCSDKVSASTTLVVGQDQVNSSLNEYLKDRPGMNLSSKRESIRTKVLGDFKTCMGKGSNQGKCIDDLKREATSSIVLNYGRVEIKSQLNADKTPANLRPVEDDLIACTDSKLEGEALANHLDECTKSFALSFARELGTLKFTYLLKQTLGTASYNQQKSEIDDSINKYTSCLDELKKYKMSEGLTDKLTVCTDGLTNRGMAMVRGNINNWMSSDQKDAATLMLKKGFSDFIPCLSGLLPPSPYNQKLQQNIDSSVKPVALLLAHYIEYNPENAKQTLEAIVKNFSIDLNDVAATNKAKHELIDFLYASGALDQFLKAVVRGTVKDALIDIPTKDVPQELKDILVKKENFEEMFNSPDGMRIKDTILNKVIKPALIDNQDMGTPASKASLEAIKDNVIKLLINAPSFGEQAIKIGIQNQINGMNGVVKFFAKTLYGANALQWEKVRQTEDGKKAEAFIKEYVLTPKFKGTIQTPAEQKKINDEAEKLVTKAVKSYG